MTKTALNKINFYLNMSAFAYRTDILAEDGNKQSSSTYHFFVIAENIFEAFSTIKDVEDDLFETLVNAQEADFDNSLDFLDWKSYVSRCFIATFDALKQIA